MREAGLEVEFDAAGNVVGRLLGQRARSTRDLERVASRHAAGRRALRRRARHAPGARRRRGDARATVRRAARSAAMAFRLEEGPRFGRGYFGSRAVCGALDDDEGDLVDPDGITLAEAFAALGYGELPREGLARPAARCLRRGAHRAGPDARRDGRAARHRHVDRGHGRPGAHVHGPPRPRGHRADAAPIRRARRRRALRRRRSRRRPRAARCGRDDRPHDGRARRDEHDSRALRAVRRRCARPTTSGSRPWWRASTAAAHEAAKAADCEVAIEQSWRYEAVAMSDPPRGRAAARGRGARASSRSSFPRARATTPRSSRSRACPARCSSCAATRAASAMRPRSRPGSTPSSWPSRRSRARCESWPARDRLGRARAAVAARPGALRPGAEP